METEAKHRLLGVFDFEIRKLFESLLFDYYYYLIVYVYKMRLQIILFKVLVKIEFRIK